MTLLRTTTHSLQRGQCKVEFGRMLGHGMTWLDCPKDSVEQVEDLEYTRLDDL